MLITIYDSVGNPKVDLSPNDSSTQVKEVQGDSVLSLSFTHYEHIELDVDDYADFLGERFWLTEKYRPRQNSRKEWVYNLKLYGVESMIKRLLVIKTVDDEDDPVFTLTAPPHEHVAMIVKCMNNGLGNITDWKVGKVDGTENIVIDYFGKYCNEALKEIAEKVGAEAWVEGQTVNICKCEHGEPIPMGYDKGLLSIDPGTADNVKFYTRLYPVGSSRNIDREKYGFSRLQLPGGQKYVEINAEKYGRVDHYEADAFADIYPRRTGIVSNVRSEVKTGEDGNPFTIYYFSDNNLPFDPNAYEIGGLVKRVSFQEGSELAGLGQEDNGTYFFEVNFNSSTREFEIITIWPYDNDMQLPGDKLIPKIGDKYILWNLRMPDEYYALAEEEFMSAVDKYNADHNLDISVYKAPTDHVWIEDNDVVLTIGQRIRLESDEYFPETGYRDSRITKITRKVNLPSSMDIEISDALSRTSQEKMTDSIADVRSYARSIEESINLPDMIRTGDKTIPTDNNIFSARRSLREFISRLKDDRTPFKVSSDKGFEVGNYSAGATGGIIGIDEKGESFAEVGKLWVRVKAFFEELTIVRSRVLAGKQYITPGGGIRCTHVRAKDASGNILADVSSPDAAEYVCYFLSQQDGEKIESMFKAGDQAICESFHAQTGTLQKVKNRFYWRRVISVNNDNYTDQNGNHYGYLILSAIDCANGSDIPQAGDEICQLGYRYSDDTGRQTAMVMSTVDADAPSVNLYAGINGFSLEGKSVVSFGCDPIYGNIFFRLGSSKDTHYLEYTQNEGLEVAGKISTKATIEGKTVNNYIKEVAASVAEAFTFDLSRDTIAVPTDSGGTPLNAILSAKATLYRGTEVWEADSFSIKNITPANGVIASITPEGIISLSNLTADSVSVEIQASYGDWDFTATLEVYKVRPGADGKTPNIYEVVTDTDVIKKSMTGELTPSSIVIRTYVTVGNNVPVLTSTGALYLTQLPNGNETQIGRSSGTGITNPIAISKDTESVVIEYRSGNGNVYDRKRIPVLSDASDIQIGTRNILRYSKTLTVNNPNNNVWGNNFLLLTKPLEANTYYAFRVGKMYEYNGVQPTSGTFAMRIYNTSVTTIYQQFSISVNDRYVVFKPSQSIPAGAKLFLYSGDSTTGTVFEGALHYYYVSLVEGNVPLTDWQAAPEDIDEAIGKFDYIEDALKENSSLQGGLFLTSVVSLGQNNSDYTSQITWSGLNGIYNPNAVGGGISAWYGGDMYDLAEYKDWSDLQGEWVAKRNVTIPSRIAKGVDRMDGSGYRAGGNLWWNAQGDITLIGTISARGTFSGVRRRQVIEITAENVNRYIGEEYHLPIDHVGAVIYCKMVPKVIFVLPTPEPSYLGEQIVVVADKNMTANAGIADVGVTGKIISKEDADQGYISTNSPIIRKGDICVFTCMLVTDTVGKGHIRWVVEHREYVPIQ